MLRATLKPQKLLEPSVNERNLVDLLLNQAKQSPTQVALRVKRKGVYLDIAWKTFCRYVIQVALALHQFGIKKEDRVAILSENRPEWAYADLGILSVGGIVVPIYPTSSPREIEHVLLHCEANFIFVSTAEQLGRVKSLGKALEKIKIIVLFDPISKEGNIVSSFEDFIQSVRPEEESNQALFNSLVSQVGLDDLATIIYTSGTTGPPKGVMLSHRNFLVNCYDAKEALPLERADLLLSFLPLSHVFERMAGYYLSLLCGSAIAYAENMNTVPENLVEVHPTITCGVPRFFEKMYARVQIEVEKSSFPHKAIFQWAIKVGNQSSHFQIEKKQLPIFLLFQRFFAQKLVYSKIYKKLGGRLRCFVSGGAPLAKELAEFFYSVGVLILEGYGLTETSPVIAVNRWEHFKFGSVGLPLRNVETKIAEDGEIVVRGPSVMSGYYKDEAATREVLQNGWFRTGDLGRIDSDGFLFITGRKKDIIKTSGGKMISPQNIENLILTDLVFSQFIIVGDKRKFITALVVPNFDQLKLILKKRVDMVEEMTPQELIQNPAVHEIIRERIEAHTKDLASYEKIKYFTLLAKEFSQEKGEMTLTLKIKRAMVQEHFREAVERMYQETEKQDDEGRNRIFFVL